MAADFASLATVKTELAITDTSVDARVRDYMAAATGMLIDFMNRDPRVSDYVEKYSGTDGPRLLLKNYPIAAVYKVVVTGYAGLETVVTTDQVDYESSTLYRLCGIWPRGTRNIEVTYSAGREDDELRAVRTAYLMTVRALWSAKASNLNATGESWSGVSSETWNPGGPGQIPPAAQAMLQSFRDTSL